MRQASVLLGAILALGASSAMASTGDYHGAYDFEFTGTVSGLDRYGFFGVSGANLVNAPFSERVSLDLSKASKTGAANYVDWSSNAAKFMITSITVGGRSYTLSQNDSQSAVLDYGNANYKNDNGRSYYVELNDSQNDSSHGVAGVVSTTQTIYNPPSDFGQRFSSSSASGTFTFTPTSDCDPVETLRLKDMVASAPEPGVWALMMLGVSMIGYALGRDRRKMRGKAAV